MWTRTKCAKRTKEFALRIINLIGALPANRVGDVLGRQILKSGTSIGANYREAVHASSKKHFISITEIALREADETLYWLELLGESKIIEPARLTELAKECDELVAMLTSTVKTAKKNQ